MGDLTCTRCGTTYRGAATDHLPTLVGRRGRIVRVEGVPCVRLACLCETNGRGHAEPFAIGMALPVGAGDEVIVSAPHAVDTLATVVRCTRTQLVLSVRGTERRFDAGTGRERGGDGRLDGDELKLARLMVAGRMLRPAATPRTRDGAP